MPIDNAEQTFPDGKIKKILDEIFELINRGDPSAAEVVREGLQLARKTGDKRSIAEMYVMSAKAARNAMKFEQVESHLKRALKLSEEIDDNLSLKSSIYHGLGLNYCEGKGQLSKGKACFLKALELSQKSGNKVVEAATLRRLGEFYYHKQLYANAFSYLKEALDVSHQLGDVAEQAAICLVIAQVLITLEDSRHALTYVHRSYWRFQSADITVGTAESTRKIAIIHSHRRDYGNAEKCFKKAALIFKNGARFHYVNVLLDFVEMLLRSNQITQARKNIEAVKEAYQGIESPFMLRSIESYWGRSLIRSGKVEEGIECLENNTQERLLAKEEKFLQVNHLFLAEAYESLGNQEKALENYKCYMELHKRAVSTHVQRIISSLELHGELQKHQSKRNLQSDTSASLAEEAEIRLKDIARASLQLEKSSKILDHVQSTLTPAKLMQGSLGEKLGELLAVVEENVVIKRAWTNFSDRLPSLDPNFIEAVKERFPNLSPAEQRVCWLLKINLSTKEIASLLGVTVSTLKTHRLRIRKKLKLPKKQSLVVALTKL